MIDHVTIFVSDLERSKRFYELALAPLGFRLSFGEEGFFWAFDLGHGLFEIAQHQGNSPITSSHIAFRAVSRDAVHLFHEAALLAGATNHGMPGPRPHYTENYYAGFVLDPDGHNIEALHDKWKDFPHR
jgi:catechol 2,3-dioxygenase-like lactoylglutathione lyase family enzyme